MSDRSISELSRIEDALDTLLDAITHRKPPPLAFDVLSWDELLKASPIEALLADPIGQALRIGIGRLGARLFALGGTELMQATCHRVADMDLHRAGWRLDIMDKFWSGIGSDSDRWIA